jgi:two-component system cell cycle sensor histidine kinase/response regulator CckA
MQSKVGRQRIGAAEAALGISGQGWLLLAAALACLCIAFLASDLALRQGAVILAATLSLLVVVIGVAGWLRQSGERRLERTLERMAGADATPCFTTDAAGVVGFLNAAAVKRFGQAEGGSLAAALNDHFASPSSVLFRLQSRAEASGAAREDVVTRAGHLRLSAHRIDKGRFLWRLEEFADRTDGGRGAESLSLPMLVANKAGVILFMNEAMRRLLGGRPKHLDRVLAAPMPGSGDIVDIMSANGPVRAVLALVEGRGERREVFLLPLAATELAEGAPADFDSVPVALLKLGADGRVRAANRAARDLLGLEPMAGQTTLGELFEGPGRPVADWVGDVGSGRLPGGSEVLRLRRGEDEAHFQVTLRRMVENGRSSVVAVLNDATALKTLEAQFVQGQKMQAIGQLAGGIAHDFNNLLTAISGHCDLLLLRHDQSDPDYADLQQVHQNANRAASLVGQLLAFSRKQTLKPERIDLQEALSDLTHLLNRLVGEKINLKLAHAPGLGPVRADKRQLEQVVMNLVVNARDAMPEGGTIRIETEALSLTEDLRRDRALVPRGDYAVIRVMDTGTGIPPERLTKVFEPFFTTKRVGEGTGLGLSMAYGIVKQSGGFIFVDSEVGLGTVFHIYLPIRDDIPAPPERPVERRRPLVRQGEGVVLLVEDEAPVRAFASRALRLRGYTVIEAENAEEALKRLEDPALNVDIFVTDVVMPGLDGPSWVRQALKDRPQARVVFMSGYAEEVFADHGDRIPNSVFLPKPFSLDDLTRTVQDRMRP